MANPSRSAYYCKFMTSSIYIFTSEFICVNKTMERLPIPAESKNQNTQHSSCYKNSLVYFRNFCENTSIHGFKFLGERKRFIFEKLFWIIVLGGAFYGSSMLIFNTYNKWLSSPVVVTFATTETPIWQIPFPAVTICSEVKTYAINFNYSQIYMKLYEEENITKEERTRFNFLSLVCNEDFDFIKINESKFLTEDEINEFTIDFPDINMSTCQWLGIDTEDCDELFSGIITSEGWCKTFNMLDYNDIYKHENESREVNATNWTLERGYPLDEGIDTFPRRTIISGINGGLQVDLVIDDEDLDYACTDLQGFKVTLHHPAEEPDMDKHFRIPLDQTVVVGVRPRMITTSEEIGSYKIKQRQCYLPGEKYLSSYKIYTQQNCLMECLLNYTMQQCQCIPFYLPNNEDDVFSCGIGSKKCINDAKVEFLKTEVESELYKKFGKTSSQCDCLPACSSIEFELELSQIDWNWRKTYSMRSDLSKFNMIIDAPSSHMSRLQIYYKDSKFIRSERHEFYGTVEFLANCGGLLGLCCGFSIISFVEIGYYYLSIRLISNFYKFNRRVWSDSRES